MYNANGSCNFIAAYRQFRERLATSRARWAEHEALVQERVAPRAADNSPEFYRLLKELGGDPLSDAGETADAAVDEVAEIILGAEPKALLDAAIQAEVLRQWHAYHLWDPGSPWWKGHHGYDDGDFQYIRGVLDRLGDLLWIEPDPFAVAKPDPLAAAIHQFAAAIAEQNAIEDDDCPEAVLATGRANELLNDLADKPPRPTTIAGCATALAQITENMEAGDSAYHLPVLRVVRDYLHGAAPLEVSPPGPGDLHPSSVRAGMDHTVAGIAEFAHILGRFGESVPGKDGDAIVHLSEVLGGHHQVLVDMVSQTRRLIPGGGHG